MFKVLRASAHDIPLPPKSIHCIVTSPPYLSLRAYAGEQLMEWPAVTYAPMVGAAPITIIGCDPDCTHEWGEQRIVHQRGNGKSTLDSNQNRARQTTATTGQYCQLCGGWRGGLGQEPNVESFIGHLILCLRNWGKILRDDGSCFVNLGDSYTGSGGSGGDYGKGGLKEGQPKTKGARKITGIPAKNLLLVPERFRLAAQADGWIVRSQFPWVKASSMPESVRDRPSNSIESWVMLTKKQHYYWDPEATTQETATVSGNGSGSFKRDNKRSAAVVPGNTATHREDRPAVEYSGTRTRRTGDWMFETIDETITKTRHWIAEAQQWVAHAEQVRENQGLLLDNDGDPMAMLVNPRPFAGAHFAAFPEGVVTPIIQSATSAHGCCSKCGSPYRRVVERVPALAADGKTCTKCGKNHGKPAGKDHDEDGAQEHHMADYYKGVYVCMDKRTIGWEATCACGADVIPCTVLDPFMGSGTTLKVATGLNRSSVGVDISQEYIDNVLPIRFESGVQIGLQF